MFSPKPMLDTLVSYAPVALYSKRALAHSAGYALIRKKRSGISSLYTEILRISIIQLYSGFEWCRHYYMANGNLSKVI